MIFSYPDMNYKVEREYEGEKKANKRANHRDLSNSPHFISSVSTRHFRWHGS
jgi:hypothetical protein